MGAFSPVLCSSSLPLSCNLSFTFRIYLLSSPCDLRRLLEALSCLPVSSVPSKRSLVRLSRRSPVSGVRPLPFVSGAHSL